MNLPDASVIESGTSILFLGAGFSAEATNTNGDKIKDVSALISYLLTASNISSSDGYDLDTAAEEYQKLHGDEKTVIALHSNFRTKAYTADQATIVTQPWRRIYTTNYDDVIETICSDNRKPITTHGMKDAVSQPMPDTTQLLHIYGNVGRSSARDFAETFLLTERQRDNSPFLNSPWMRAFHDDVLASSSLIFVGFSLTDIDIRRLLGIMPIEVHQKIHFINRPTTKQPILTRMSKFGTPHSIGLSSFATHLGVKRPGAAVRSYTSLPIGVQEAFYRPKLSDSISAVDIERLFISGSLVTDKLSESDISCEPGAYTMSRSKAAYQRAGNNATGITPVLVYSDIGNGKTVFANQMGYLYAQKGSRVLWFQREPENIGDILSYLQAANEPCLLIFDDVMRFPKLPTAILAMRKSNLVILATVRTSFLDTSLSAVRGRLANVTCIDIDLDIMQRDESRRTVEYLKTNGLLGRYADLPESDKLLFIEKTCGGQVRDVVLSLYETGALHSRVEALLVNIQQLDKETQDLVIFSSVLTQAGYQDLSSVWLLSQMLNYSGAIEDLKGALVKCELGSLVKIDEGDLTIRSPALAEFILTRVFNIETILDSVKRALFFVDKYLSSEDDLIKMAKGLMKFSLYGRIIKSKSQNAVIERFYNDCRLLSFAASDPLFWVQRSICAMNDGDFTISYRFIDNAYGLASGRKSWDTYQIDNHNARVMLTQSLKEGVSVDGAREKDAISLLQSVLSRKNDDLYHPLSVMRIYADIVERYSDTLTVEQKASLKVSLNAASRSIAKFKHTGRFRNLSGLRTRLDGAVKALG